jgi:hypothetical protein
MRKGSPLPRKDDVQIHRGVKPMLTPWSGWMAAWIQIAS